MPHFSNSPKLTHILDPPSKSDDVSTSENFEICLSHVVELQKVANESALRFGSKCLIEALELLQSTGFASGLSTRWRALLPEHGTGSEAPTILRFEHTIRKSIGK